MPTPNDAAKLLQSVRTQHDCKTAYLTEMADDAVFLYQRLMSADLCEDHALELTTFIYDIYQENNEH